MITDTKSPLVAAARRVGEETISKYAAEIDEQYRFPKENIEALYAENLMSLFIPESLGGTPCSYQEYCHVASVLGEYCLSTALIWVMHTLQLALLADHAADEQAEVMRDIASTGALLGSVTTEFGKGSSLLNIKSPLEFDGDKMFVRRKTPISSYGKHAKYFLLTMRADENAPSSDTRLVLLKRDDKGTIETHGDWRAMGMRGTGSIPMSFDVEVDKSRMLSKPFRTLAMESMVPVSHLGWTAAWYGAASGAYRRYIKTARQANARGLNLFQSDLFTHRLAQVRVSLDMTLSMISHLALKYDDLRDNSAPAAAYEDATLKILVNNLKVGVSKLMFEVADDLIEMAGMSLGYRQGHDLALERLFRDLRSGALMYNNDQILAANGKLVLMEKTKLFK